MILTNGNNEYNTSSSLTKLEWLKKVLCQILRRIIIVTLLTILGGAAFMLSLYFYYRSELPTIDNVQEIQNKTFSDDNQIKARSTNKVYIPLKLEKIPEQLIQAVLATEDNRFYFHYGVDPVGIFYAIVEALTSADGRGGSTITMQVARNLFLTNERTYVRKIKEIFIAIDIENLLTKDEILALYLNNVELGHRAFGVGAAAKVYYDKGVEQLSLAEIAMIAGLPQAPSRLNPITSPIRAKRRRSIVLQSMFNEDYITEQEYKIALQVPINNKR